MPRDIIENPWVLRRDETRTLVYSCHNPDCKNYLVDIEVEGIYENDTGSRYAHFDDDTICEKCGEEME